jgi:ParB family chromosome partitioning protein
MNRKALGRGLSALLGEENQKENEGFSEIDLDLIEANPQQPRTQFTEENLNDLAQSIKANGVVQPIVVRKKNGKYEIVAGERRWRASQKAGLQRIPAVVRNIEDDKLLELALIENIQRQELNPIEEAKAYKKLIETLGLTQELVAERVGKNRAVVANYLRILRLPENVQDHISNNKLSVGHAKVLLSVENPEIQRQITKNIIEMNLSVRETEKMIKRLSKGGDAVQKSEKLQPKTNANFKAAETKLRRQYGTQVKIVADGKGTGGKIELEYYSESDLDRIFQLMMSE